MLIFLVNPYPQSQIRRWYESYFQVIDKTLKDNDELSNNNKKKLLELIFKNRIKKNL